MNVLTLLATKTPNVIIYREIIVAHVIKVILEMEPTALVCKIQDHSILSNPIHGQKFRAVLYSTDPYISAINID